MTKLTPKTQKRCVAFPTLSWRRIALCRVEPERNLSQGIDERLDSSMVSGAAMASMRDHWQPLLGCEARRSNEGGSTVAYCERTDTELTG